MRQIAKSAVHACMNTDEFAIWHMALCHKSQPEAAKQRKSTMWMAETCMAELLEAATG